MKNRKFNYSFFFFVVILIFSFYERNEMTTITFSKLDLSVDEMNLRYRLLLFVLCGGFCLFNPRPKNHLSLVFTVMMVYILGVSMFNIETGNSSKYIMLSATILLPIPIFYYFFNAAQTINTRYFYCGIIFACVLIFISFLSVYQVQLYYALTDETRAGSLYIFLFLLPLFLIVKKNLYKYVSIFVVAAAMVFSLKRGGAISFAMALVIFYLVNIHIAKGGIKIKNIVLMVVALIVIYLIITIGMQNYAGDMFERLESMREDEGSARVQVYETTWNMIVNSDISKLWLGHGWDSVVKYSPMNLSAHNDFLEVIYDFGIIAFGLYLYFYYSLYKLMFRLIHRRSEYAPAFAFSVITFTINSTVAHILIYPYYYIAVAAVWGYILGKEKQFLIHRLK